MSPEQQAAFNIHGCVCRCLIKLSEMFGNPVSADEFCARFDKYFPFPNEYGRLDDIALITIFRQLNLTPNIGLHGSFEVVADRFNNAGQRVMVSSLKNLNPGMNNFNGHCSVLTAINPVAQTFSIWTPVQDGTNAPLNLTKADWVDKECSGMILF